MSAEPDDTRPSASELALAVEPLDTIGATTADRFAWHAAMAAADGLALYWTALGRDGRLAEVEHPRILCEWHTDWVVVHDKNVELVQAKHREPALGGYTTLRQLIDDGGIAQFFLRWLSLDEKPTCRLVTTAGPYNGLPLQLEAACKSLWQQRLQCKELALASNFEDLLTGTCNALKNVFDASAGKGRNEVPTHWLLDNAEGAFPLPAHTAQLTRFLSMLTIDHGRPMRSHANHAAPGMYVGPVLDRMKADIPLEAAWGAVLALFRDRMGATGTMPSSALTSRTVTMADIDRAIRSAIANGGEHRSFAGAAGSGAGECVASVGVAGGSGLHATIGHETSEVDTLLRQLLANQTALRDDQRKLLIGQEIIAQGQATSCPGTFVIIPKSRRIKLWKTRVQLKLYCGAPGSEHPLPNGIGIYDLADPPEWLAKVGPYLDKILAILKVAVPPATAVMGVAAEVLTGRCHDDLDRIETWLKRAKGVSAPNHELTLPEVRRGQAAAYQLKTEAEFRHVMALLTKLDPNRTWGGLIEHTTRDGTHYLCHEHFKIARRFEQQRDQD